MADETQAVDLDARIKALQEERRVERAVEKQRATLRPQLVARIRKWDAEIQSITVQRDSAMEVLAEIDRGHPTDFRLRKPPTRRKKVERGIPDSDGAL